METPGYTPQPAAPEQKSNKTGLIIAVVLVVLCCCCLAIVAGGWFFGDAIVEALG